MRVRLTAVGRRTFSAVRVRNYRLYLFGQALSLSGTWMQGVAQAWLVLKLTGSGTALGLVTAAQFLPVLLFGPWGGVIADRVDKRRLLVCTQAVSGLLALVLGVLVATDLVQLWMVYALALGLGLVSCVDNPSRQTFVLEMVGREELANAVTLNSVVINLARVIGPAIAGALIAFVGLAACFLLNAASYVAVIAALLAMHRDELQTVAPQPRASGQLREGFAYVRRSPELLVPLLMMAVVGTLAYEFQVILPLVARDVFDGGAGTYSTMTAALGVGAVVGGLVTASKGTPTRRRFVGASLGFGALILLAAVAPTLPLHVAALVIVGGGSIAFLSMGNTSLQLGASPDMRGRVMALWSVAFLGSTPVGGPIIGWIGQHVGARWGLALGGAATIGAAAWGGRALARLPGGLAAPVGTHVPPDAPASGAGGSGAVAAGAAISHEAGTRPDKAATAA